MFRVAGILVQQFTGKLPALSTMDKFPVPAAERHRTLAMERMAICGNTTVAMTGFSVAAALASQAASGIDHAGFPFLSSLKTANVDRIPSS